MNKPKPGDKIYVEGTIYLHHGVDDFHGGICTVKAARTGIESNGKEITDVEIEEDPGTMYRWDGYLELYQEEWRKRYGERKGQRTPDLHPEFNDDWSDAGI